MSKRRRHPRSRAKSGIRYSLDFKLHVVHLFLDEGYTRDEISRELGICVTTVSDWARTYRERGEEGLRPKIRGAGRTQVGLPAKQKAIDLKREHPEFGSLRISQLLRRLFHIGVSAETVRKTLHDEDLIKAPRRKPKRNPSALRVEEPCAGVCCVPGAVVWLRLTIINT